MKKVVLVALFVAMALVLMADVTGDGHVRGYIGYNTGIPLDASVGVEGQADNGNWYEEDFVFHNDYNGNFCLSYSCACGFAYRLKIHIYDLDGTGVYRYRYFICAGNNQHVNYVIQPNSGS